MGFDESKFSKITFTDRTEDVPVPRLKAFFGEDETPIWIIKGLTGPESAKAKQAVQENSNLEAIIKAIGSRVQADLVDGIKELANLNSEKVPDDLVQRYLWIELGSVDPICSHDLAMQLALNFPEDFYMITNKIIHLTGQGRLGE